MFPVQVKQKDLGQSLFQAALQSFEENNFKVWTSLSQEYIEPCQKSVMGCFFKK